MSIHEHEKGFADWVDSQRASGLKEPSTVPDPSKQKERIVAAAILQDGVVYTGTRHAFIIRDIVLMTGTKPITGQQGFVTSTGQFVSREIAGEIAMRSGQVTHLKYQRTQLFSEELWDIPSGLEFNEQELQALLSENPPSSPGNAEGADKKDLELKEPTPDLHAAIQKERDDLIAAIQAKVEGKSITGWLAEQFPATIGNHALRRYFTGLGNACVVIEPSVGRGLSSDEGSGNPKSGCGVAAEDGKGEELGWCDICNRYRYAPNDMGDQKCECSGLQPYSLSTYPGEYCLVKTHPGNGCEQWYKREEVDELIRQPSKTSSLDGKGEEWTEARCLANKITASLKFAGYIQVRGDEMRSLELELEKMADASLSRLQERIKGLESRIADMNKYWPETRPRDIDE